MEHFDWFRRLFQCTIWYWSFDRLSWRSIKIESGRSSQIESGRSFHFASKDRWAWLETVQIGPFSVHFWTEIKSPLFGGASVGFRLFLMNKHLIWVTVWYIFGFLKAKPEILIELSCPVGMKLRRRLGFKGLDCFESSRCPIKISEKTDYCSPNVQPSTQH